MSKETQSSRVDEISRQFLTDSGYCVTEKIEEGHLKLPIYRCANSEGEKRVVKIGFGEDGRREVNDNIFGYTGIAKVGASLLIPEGINIVETPVGTAIDLPDLGENFTQNSGTDERSKSNFSSLKQSVLTAVKQTTINNPESHTEGVGETLKQLRKWCGLLVENRVANKQILKDIDTIDPSSISGDKSSVMILDFTPDNVFVNDGKTKFIDPWRQNSYLGTPIPSISQFVTLSEDVYRIPGFNEANVEYGSLFDEVGNELNLDTRKLSAQRNLGRALQFSLSSFVRINTNPEKSNYFAQQCSDNIKMMNNI